MLIMLFLILVCAFFFIVGIAALKEAEDEAGLVAIFLSFLFLVPVVAPLINSYGSYIDMKQTYEATISQYRNSIKMYEDKAVIHVSKKTFTDFKYKGYQEEVSSLIKDLRNKVEEYNELYIGKKEMGSNIFISWYIIGPDDNMKLIKLRTGGGME